jgi:uncharacterized surface protein with fasciclin (FAS1) repeats
MRLSFLYGILLGIVVSYLTVIFASQFTRPEPEILRNEGIGIGGSPPRIEHGEPVLANNDFDALVKEGKFTIFVEALSAGGLSEKISGPDYYTVFAPTDEAFLKVSPELMYMLISNREVLRTFLNHHIVLGSVDAQNGVTVKNLNGTSVKFTSASDPEEAKIDGRVISAKMQTSNGVIYVVGDLLLPPDFLLEPPKQI